MRHGGTVQMKMSPCDRLIDNSAFRNSDGKLFQTRSCGSSCKGPVPETAWCSVDSQLASSCQLHALWSIVIENKKRKYGNERFFLHKSPPATQRTLVTGCYASLFLGSDCWSRHMGHRQGV